MKRASLAEISLQRVLLQFRTLPRPNIQYSIMPRFFTQLGQPLTIKARVCDVGGPPVIGALARASDPGPSYDS